MTENERKFFREIATGQNHGVELSASDRKLFRNCAATQNADLRKHFRQTRDAELDRVCASGDARREAAEDRLRKQRRPVAEVHEEQLREKGEDARIPRFLRSKLQFDSDRID